MAEENIVTLYGTWTSPYAKRVELALKVKGIPYEFVLEDLNNKSQLLLNYNPVHKKVPVLVHNGKPIAESHVILEYIDETWKNGPKLLPDDPYNRAQFRFWAGFLQQQVYETMFLVMRMEGEAQEKATEELHEKFEILEEGMKGLFPDGTPFDGENMGLLDILMCITFGPYKAQEEVLGVKIINSEKNPLIFSWVNSLIEVTLQGSWASPYSKGVELALKLKGIPYEFVQENLANKSPSLLKYNPVYNKIPVLVHCGKPISESLVILEYIHETWKNCPRFLPDDPNRRAQLRFWAGFFDQQVR
ncbi:hypothetical protein TIFTF001_014834 [Ficus carica]|uniref:glutathione transferase n=1 Tax=Ficus carica TaxID=3494 RepID=A0AA88A6T0_FICCA|nr:hypothetical protein TIFTF001_014834 [Ficus carica]